jgi:tRNA/tmRNA/rRNA uracil-C5-methylase (TrmA/RlmC/RlmD family)
MKAEQVKKLMDDVIDQENRDYQFLGIKESPRQTAYRNKMEFSFGDEFKDGPLALGMHKRGSFYDIVTVENCQIVDEDFRKILSVTLAYFREKNITYYHKLRHTGYLRHLLVRKAVKTGEILVDLVTTTQTDFPGIAGAQMDEVESTLNNAQENAFAGTEEELLEGWKAALLAADYKGTMTGILHTRNDNVADTVTNEGTDVLYGQDFFYEELLGLRFKITPFSFFQTNSLGAEVLYQTAREFIGDALPSGTDADIAEHGKIVFDLYSGTGTISQILSPVAKKVIGVEIVEEAVVAARENAALNGLSSGALQNTTSFIQSTESRSFERSATSNKISPIRRTASILIPVFVDARFTELQTRFVRQSAIGIERISISSAFVMPFDTSAE